MPRVTRAEQMTEVERKFIGVTPYVVAGICSQCEKQIKVRFYGYLPELLQVKLCCKDCKK